MLIKIGDSEVVANTIGEFTSRIYNSKPCAGKAISVFAPGGDWHEIPDLRVGNVWTFDVKRAWSVICEIHSTQTALVEILEELDGMDILSESEILLAGDIVSFENQNNRFD